MKPTNPQCTHCGSYNTIKSRLVYCSAGGCFVFLGLLLLPLAILFRPIGFILIGMAIYQAKKPNNKHYCKTCRKRFTYIK